MDDSMINRINELYKKSKTSGLTDAEKAEQKELRNEFLKSVRQQVVDQIHTIKVMDEGGNVVKDYSKLHGKSNHHHCHCHEHEHNHNHVHRCTHNEKE